MGRILQVPLVIYMEDAQLQSISDVASLFDVLQISFCFYMRQV